MAAQRVHGAPIARGNTSDLWEWSEGTVVKVLHPEIPAHWASIEADIIARVHAAGLPVPRTEGVVDLDGRPGIVLERIDGASMWEWMKADPQRVPAFLSQLLDLQAEVQRTNVPELVAMKDRLRRKIGEATQLTDDDRREARVLLEALPEGTALCHGDFHPANVILTERGPVILDWFDAARGDGTADYVRSSLLMRPPADRGSWLAGATPELLDHVHSHYITELVRRGAIDARTFGPWEAVMAVARMSEPVPDEDLLEVWRRWKVRGPSAARTLLDHCQELVAVQGYAS
jgi:aminoglycoside phosphotransferase (APT) family kinase protein